MAAVPAGAFNDASGDLTAGGTSEEVLPQNQGRQYLFIQNVDDTNPLWVDFGKAAVTDQPSICIPALDVLEFSIAGTGVVPTASVNVIAATTGHPFVVKEA